MNDGPEMMVFVLRDNPIGQYLIDLRNCFQTKTTPVMFYWQFPFHSSSSTFSWFLLYYSIHFLQSMEVWEINVFDLKVDTN